MHRLTRLAALVQLRVRLKDAEQLLVVGNRLALEHPPSRQAANVSCPRDKSLQLLVQRESFRAGERAVFLHRFAEGLGSRQEQVRHLQQFAVGLLQPLLVTVPFAGGDPLDRSHQPSRLAVKMFVLSPADQAEHPGQHHGRAEHLPQAVRDQTAVRRIVDVGLDHEGVATHRLGRLRFQAVPLRDDRLIDLRESFPDATG